MITHNLIQGNPEWHAYRAAHDNASDAPAMMGASSNRTRDQLIAERATGLPREFSQYMQELILDKGHRFEALARPLAETIIGQELYPVTGSLEGTRLSASFDGLTLLEDVAFEHKRLNQRLRAALSVPGCTGADLPIEYQIQMEQQCAVSGCGKILFMASDWDENDQLIEEMHCWYVPNLELRKAILAGWEQFHKDVAAWVPPEAKAAPVVGRAPEHLPALRIEVTGAVTASNLAEFKATALAAIQGVNRCLATDADFADAEASVKWCAEVEARLGAAKQHALSQTTDIDTLFRTMDDIAAEARRVRLELDKLVKARKEEIRGEIVAGGVAALREHIDQLNAAMPASYMPQVPADFGGAVKGKRTVDSLRSAVNDELARAKIAASEIANRIHANLKTLQESGLVAHDTAALALKAPDDLAAVIAQRLATEQASREAERERIRQEEQAKAQRELLAQQAQQAQADIAQAAKAGEIAPAVAPDLISLVSERHAEGVAQQVIQLAASSRVIPVPQRTEAPQQDDGARINLGTINAAQRTAAADQSMSADAANLLIGGINRRLGYEVNAAFLKQLGFEPARVDGARRFYRDSDLPLIGHAIAQHTLRVTQLQAA